MKRIKKFIKYLVLIMTSLLLLALVFPTWTSSIEDMNSISTLEQVEINGSDHEIMIRGHNKIILSSSLSMADQVALKYPTLKISRFIGNRIYSGKL